MTHCIAASFLFILRIGIGVHGITVVQQAEDVVLILDLEAGVRRFVRVDVLAVRQIVVHGDLVLRQGLAARADGPVQRQFAAALAQSNQLMAEDLLREAGYMLPQSGETRAFLEGLLAGPQPEGFPAEAARQLLALL